MNPNYTDFKFPQIKAHPWTKVFNKRMPPDAVDLVSRMLQYAPLKRVTAAQAMMHPFFDELRDPATKLPNGEERGNEGTRCTGPAHAASPAVSSKLYLAWSFCR